MLQSRVSINVQVSGGTEVIIAEEKLMEVIIVEEKLIRIVNKVATIISA